MAGAHPKLIGRENEYTRLRESVEDGAHRGAVLVGGAGVGKTAMVRSLARELSERGDVVRWVQATRAASTIPLGAFVPALGSLDGAVSPANLLARAHASLAEAKTNLLVVDDAHLLDDLSATLVEQLVDSASCTTTLTARTDGPLSPSITRLWREEMVQRIDVAALPHDAIQALLEAMLDGPVEDRLVRSIIQLSGGNLVILRELVGSALDTGAIARAETWRLVGELLPSSRLAELVEARLAALPDPHRRALDLVAVADLLPLRIAEALIGPAVLADLEDAQLLQLLDGRQISLSHGTYSGVLRANLGPIRTRELYRELAASSNLDPQPTDHDRMRTTRWRLLAGDVPEADELLVTGKLARRAYDVDLAERCGRALLATGRSVDGGLLLADVMMTGGRAPDAEEVLLSIAPDAVGDDDVVAVAEARARNFFHGLRDRASAVAVTEQALASATTTAARDRLEAHLGVLDFFAGDLPAALARAEPLLGPSAPGEAVAAAAASLALTGQISQALSVAGGLVEVAEERVTIVPAGVVEIGKAIGLVHLGLPREAQALAATQRELAVDVGFEYARTWLGYAIGIALANQGRVQSARAWFHDAAVGLSAGRNDPRARMAIAGELFCAATLGDSAAAADLLARLDRVIMPTWGWFEGEAVRAKAWAALVLHDRAAAVATLVAGAATQREQWNYIVESELLHDLVRLGHADAATTERLTELAGHMEGPFIGARARHATALGGNDAGGIEAASQEFEAMGFDLFAAEAAAQAGRVHRRASEARAAAALERRAHHLAAGCEGARTPALAGSGAAAALTDRELEIASAAAGGLTSREIAERFFLSRRTVDNYLQRVYVKLGISDRSELSDALKGVSP